MQRAYKVELKLTKQHIQKINKSIWVCRWLYNADIAKNQSLYQDFKLINNYGNKARKKFFEGKSKVGLYFPKNNKTDWKIERHRVNIPTLKEFGYIPTHTKVINGRFRSYEHTI